MILQLSNDFALQQFKLKQEESVFFAQQIEITINCNRCLTTIHIQRMNKMALAAVLLIYAESLGAKC